MQPPTSADQGGNAPLQQKASLSGGDQQQGNTSGNEKLASPSGGVETDASSRSGARRELREGDVVKTNAPRKKEFHGYTATLQSALAKHWWATFNQGPLKGGPKQKLMHSQIEQIPQPPDDGAVAKQDAAEPADAGGGAGGAEAQAAPGGGGKAEATAAHADKEAWLAAAAVF